MKAATNDTEGNTNYDTASYSTSMSSDYPLNCIDSTGDGFSGWFAITNPRQCNDFCYWSVDDKKKKSASDDTNDNEDDNEDDSYTALNTANPHETTVIYNAASANNDNTTRSTEEAVAHWVCIYNSADDKTLVSQAEGEKWIDTWHKYLDKRTMSNLYPSLNDDDGKNNNINVPFPYLRCTKGAGENLRTLPGDAANSSIFWESYILLCFVIIIAQIAVVVARYNKRKLRYDRLLATTTTTLPAVMNDDEGNDLELIDESANADDYNDRLMASNRTIEIDEAMSENSLATSDRNELPWNAASRRRCKYLAPYLSHSALKLLRIISIVAMNILLVITIAFASLSLMETKYNVQFSERMQRLTPECTNPNLACQVGNQEIDQSSSYKSPDMEFIIRIGESTTSPIKPFSYIIASDSQLHWFNGEFAEMGEKNIPLSCTEGDSCGSCTAKHGYNTNLRMKRAWETLMTAQSNNSSNVPSELTPTPNTLIMNGDLTAYFHPYQKHAYTRIYSDIDGLEHYWPGLGNHDIEHPGGAMYGGDEWIGPANCNVEHAIGYFKSGFCGQIPKFRTERIVRYDPSSLAYSWEEGRYHFVMLHYYPTYELASLSFHSSMIWLERDLQLAQDAGLSSILYVHAVQGLNPATENVILGKGVKAIFAGHTHRCLHRRCDGIYPLNEDQVSNLSSLNITVDRCIPAAYDVCGALE